MTNSDFTKECRELRKKGATAEQLEYAEKMMKACKINDRLETENKSQAEHIELLNQCDDSSTEVIGKMDVEIEQLEASRKELLTAFKELAATFVGLSEGSIGWQVMKKVNDAIKQGELAERK